jgi:hypothetical protein
LDEGLYGVFNMAAYLDITEYMMAYGLTDPEPVALEIRTKIVEYLHLWEFIFIERLDSLPVQVIGFVESRLVRHCGEPVIFGHDSWLDSWQRFVLVFLSLLVHLKDMNKPNGQYFLPANQERILEFLKDLPVRRVSGNHGQAWREIGIGRVQEKILKALGIQTCGQLVGYDTHSF